MTKEALTLALEALEPLIVERTCEAMDAGEKAIIAIKEALAQPEQETCKGCNGNGVVGNILDTVPCPFCKGTGVEAQPEQEPVECDCNQGQSCHVCDPYFPFDSAPQTTRLTQKTTTNDVAIGVDVTEDGTHVTAMRMRPDGINIVIYSQFHPLAQPEQEPVVLRFNEWTVGKNDLSDHICIGELTLAGIEDNLEGPEFGEAEIERFDTVIEALQEKLVTGRECKKVPLIAYIGVNNTTPPQRTWVGLTDEEIMAIGRELGAKCRLGGNPNIDFDYARAIEAKLKEKNSA